MNNLYFSVAHAIESVMDTHNDHAVIYNPMCPSRTRCWLDAVWDLLLCLLIIATRHLGQTYQELHSPECAASQSLAQFPA